MNDLDECPYCGHDADFVALDDGYTVRCSRYLCIASSICCFYPSKEEAKKNWNRRTKFVYNPNGIHEVN